MRKVIQNIKSASKARQLLQEQKFYDCIELCNTQIESTPNDFYSFYYRAQCKTHLKLYDEAIQDFEEALVNADKNAFPNFMKELKQEIGVRIVNIYRRQRMTEKALGYLDILIQQYPKYSGGFTERAGILSDMGQYQLALDNINIAIKHSPKDKKLIDFRAELINFITS
ncbi:tetratricopeptide repeat protein [Algoriphagus yeomjeoni]|uniref:tetratricopeptide repeat protein n=1 Tax=Algoriphagus yeomjeoni TaxID=291403 RepID=UPI003CE58E0D